MKKVILFFVVTLVLNFQAFAEIIYSTDFIQSPNGATSAINKGEFKTQAPTWATDYPNYFQTTGSAGTITYTFSPEINLSGFSNIQLTIQWGSTSNRPLKVGINGASVVQIDNIASSSDRSQVRNATTNISANNISSIQVTSSGGGNVFLFHLEITGDSQGGGGTTTTYTITYEMNGHGSAISPVTDATALPATLPTPTAEGWTFVGWYTDSSLTTAAVAGTAISANTTLYAKWNQNGGTTPVTYSVTYNMNGHGAAIAQLNDVTALPNPLPTPTAEGYTFGGWYTDSNLTTAAVAGAAINANTTLYAKWTQNGGTTPVTPPTTTLTIHETEIYEANTRDGGYGTPLVTFGGREYEVYYFSKYKPNGSDIIGVSTYTDLTNGQIVSSPNGTSNSFSANDGWFSGSAQGIEGSSFSASAYTGTPKATAIDEFANCIGDIKFYNNNTFTLHIKGYDQFTIYAKDNNTDKTKGKYLKVYIDDVEQTMTLNSTTPSIRRFNITTGEHVIKVEGIGGSNNYIYGFSMRVAYVPKVKHIDGNDSTQQVRQTDAIHPITYYLKNRISDAELTWNGAAATGISLQAGANDTLYLQGNANCPIGQYSYTISAKDADNNVVSQLNGSFYVKSEIVARNNNMLNTSVYQNTPITPIVFNYYALTAEDVTYTWTSTAPRGLNFTTDNTTHTLTLSGTPTTVGVYTYTVSVAGGNTLNGTIEVESNTPTIVDRNAKTILYLYKEKKDGMFNYLKTKYNYFARKASAEMSDVSQYQGYDVVVISEDVDATNGEALSIINSLSKPVLNMKIFTYSPTRLNWGNPDNGSILNTTATVLQPTHPIFAGLGNQVEIISKVESNRGLMPAEVNYAGTICLATAPTRGDDYISNGAPQTLIHEVPAAIRGAKYLSLPIGSASSANLTRDGKKLVDNMIAYLTTTNAAPFTAPVVEITAFEINGIRGQIDQNAHTINLTMPAGTNVTALTPTITLANPQLTYVTPNNGEAVDFSDTHYGVVYTVSDYITRVNYVVKVMVPTALEDIEEDGIWYADATLHNLHGEWVNIYSISGQKITTTNSDFSFDGMQHGIYIIQTSNRTLKIIH